MTVKLGIPSKGRLMQETLDWFAARGVTITRTGSDREYVGSVSGVHDAQRRAWLVTHRTDVGSGRS